MNIFNFLPRWKWEYSSCSVLVDVAGSVCVSEDLKLKFVCHRIWNRCVTHDYVFQGRVIPLYLQRLCHQSLYWCIEPTFLLISTVTRSLPFQDENGGTMQQLRCFRNDLWRSFTHHDWSEDQGVFSTQVPWGSKVKCNVTGIQVQPHHQSPVIICK